jgi:hypothetical protein
MALATPSAEKIVTFDFPHHFGPSALYEHYLKYLAGG